MSKLKLCLFLIFLHSGLEVPNQRQRRILWIILDQLVISAQFFTQIALSKKNCYTVQAHSAPRQISLSSVHFCTHSLPLLQRYSKILPYSSVNCTGWLFIASQSNVQRQLLLKTGSSFWRLFSNSGEISVDLTAKCEVTISPHQKSHHDVV